MYLLSRIIVKEWFKSLFGALTVLFLLITIGDIINGFLQNYEMRRIFFEYVLKLPDLFGKMLPISCLLATLFSINKLKSHSELMGILAGGFSVKSIYSIILVCAFTLSALQFINQAYILPHANFIKRSEFEKSRKNESRYLARSKIGKEGLIWYKSNNYFTSFKAFDSKNNTLKDVTIYFLSNDKKILSIYKSNKAKFVSKGKWKLFDLHILKDLNNKQFPISSNEDNLIIDLDESPEDFGQFESDITTLDFFSLGSFIERLKSTDINSSEYEVMYFEKISLVVICIVFALFPIAAIFNPNKRSGGFGKDVVFTLVFTVGFFGIQSLGLSLGTSSKLPPSLATLGFPLLFAMYILSIYLKKRSL